MSLYDLFIDGISFVVVSWAATNFAVFVVRREDGTSLYRVYSYFPVTVTKRENMRFVVILVKFQVKLFKIPNHISWFWFLIEKTHIRDKNIPHLSQCAAACFAGPSGDWSFLFRDCWIYNLHRDSYFHQYRCHKC